MDIKGLVEKTVESFDPLYKKVKGGYISIAVAIIGIITLSICSMLYSAVEPFTIYSHWVSNLGGARTNWGLSPNGSNIVFSVGMITLSILAVPAVIYLLKIILAGYQKFEWLPIIAAISGIYCLLGIVGVAIFDMKSSIMLHVIFAAIFFIGGALMIFLFSITILYDAEISNIYGILGTLMSGVGLLFLLSLVPYLIQGNDPFFLIGSVSPSLAFTRFWEWMYVFSMFAWFIMIGILALKHEV
ncbi:MAG: hypothetical protein ACTSRG_09300 [Candidatus Helarchaeota archaeon]